MSVVRKVLPMLAIALLCAIAVTGILAWHNGYRIYIVETGSMVPTLLSGDAVLDGPASGNYQPGEIVTFRHPAETTNLVTHRVAEVRSGVIRTKGDANLTADALGISPSQVQGVYVTRLPRLGYLLVFLRKPTGIVAVVIGVVALMLLWDLVSASTKKKKVSRPAREQA